MKTKMDLLLRVGLKAATGFSIGNVLSNIIETVTPVKVSNLTKIANLIGSMTVASMLCEKTDKYLDKVVDKWFHKNEEKSTEENKFDTMVKEEAKRREDKK